MCIALPLRSASFGVHALANGSCCHLVPPLHIPSHRSVVVHRALGCSVATEHSSPSPSLGSVTCSGQLRCYALPMFGSDLYRSSSPVPLVHRIHLCCAWFLTGHSLHYPLFDPFLISVLRTAPCRTDCVAPVRVVSVTWSTRVAPLVLSLHYHTPSRYGVVHHGDSIAPLLFHSYVQLLNRSRLRSSALLPGTRLLARTSPHRYSSVGLLAFILTFPPSRRASMMLPHHLPSLITHSGLH